MKNTSSNAGFEVDQIKIFDCVCTSETLAPAGDDFRNYDCVCTSETLAPAGVAMRFGIC
jgi:hypothetical protein